MSSSDSLRKALEEYLAVPGVIGALFVSDEGLVVSQAVPEGVDADAVAVFAADALVACQQLGRSASTGDLQSLEVEFEKGQLLVVPFASGVLLTLLLSEGQLGAVRENWSKGKDLSSQNREAPSA